VTDNKVIIIKEGIGAFIELIEESQNPDILNSAAMQEYMYKMGCESLEEMKKLYKTINEEKVNKLIARNSLDETNSN
jgi:hypothetical protein